MNTDVHRRKKVKKIKKKKQAKCPSTSEGVNTVYYIHAMKYCSVIKGMNN